jgi:hypothetical protein
MANLKPLFEGLNEKPNQKSAYDKVDIPVLNERYHVSWSSDAGMTFTLVDFGNKYATMGFVNRKKVFACLLSDLRHTRKSAKTE